MKKYIALIIIFFTIYNIFPTTKVSNIEIPSEAIRLRVIPNSNSTRDQEVKQKVKNILEQNAAKLLEDVTTVTLARKIISDNLENIETEIEKVLLEEEYNIGYKINFGQNYFPEKKFKGVTYKEGNYESLVVTLGKGAGDNWWCVLFPPLCLLEAEETETEEVEYQFFVKEIIDKYFK